MNLRKTIAGAAVAIGGAAVMLGLGGTAQAAVDAGAQTLPDVDTEPGKLAAVGDLVRVDTAHPAGPVVLGDGTGIKNMIKRVPVDLSLGLRPVQRD